MTHQTKRDRWLGDRHLGLGGSDAPAALGCDPWRSTLALYHEKRGDIEPDDIGDNPRVYWGHVLEPAVRAEVKRRVGIPVCNPGRYTIQRSEAHPFMFCTLDGLLRYATDPVHQLFQLDDQPTPNGPGVVEIKTAGHFSREQWEERWPLHYQVQTQHQLAVTGHTWGLVAVLIAGFDFRLYPFTADPEFQKAMIDSERGFWDLVQTGTPPDADASQSTADALRKLYPVDDGETIDLPAEAGIWDHRLVNAKAERKNIDETIRECENKLRAAIGSASVGVMPNGTSYTHKLQKRKAYTVDAKEFRVLRRLKPPKEKP